MSPGRPDQHGGRPRRYRQHPRFAAAYARFSPRADAAGMDAHRRELLAGLHGTVVEIGAGNGLNFSHYPPQVTRVVAVEPDDVLRAHAERAAAAAPVPVHVVAGTAEDLPLADGQAAAAVFCLVLCSVADPARALAEARRTVRPDGQLRFYEHVRSGHRLLAAAEDAATPLWRRIAAGCHPGRDTAAAISAAGWDLDAIRRFTHSPARPLPAIAHILGRARPRPAQDVDS